MTVPEVAPKSRAQSAWANAVAAYINAHIDEIAALALGIAGLDDAKVDRAGDSMEGPLHTDLSDYEDGSNFIGIQVTPKSTNSATGGAVLLDGAGSNDDILLGNYLGGLKATIGSSPTALSSGVDIAMVERGIWVPSFTNLTVGTGGNAYNSSTYTFVGGRNVGSYGILSVVGAIRLGSSGSSVGSNIQVSYPSGFSVGNANAEADGNTPIGRAFLYDSDTGGNRREAIITNWSGGQWRLAWSANPGSLATTSSTSPFTWAADDQIRYSYTVGVIRV